MAVLGREAEDMAVVMLQFWGRRLGIWGLLWGSFRPGCEDTGVVMGQFWGGRLRICGLLCGRFRPGFAWSFVLAKSREKERTNNP